MENITVKFLPEKDESLLNSYQRKYRQKNKQKAKDP